MKKKLYIMAVLLAYFLPVRAQEITDQLKGVVADSATRKPLEFASLNLSTPDKKYQQSLQTQINGSFVFYKPGTGQFMLTISYLGYHTRQIPLSLNESKVSDLDTLFIAMTSKQLDEAVVRSTRPLVKTEPGKLIYDAEADPDSRNSNLLNLMRKVPYLSIDVNNNLLLKGSGDFKVLINGRPSGMMDNNLSEILRTMPASSILRIEVITGPSAKYDAEGMNGIINIITNRKLADGYKGSVNANMAYPLGGPGAGGAVSVKRDRLAVYVYGGGGLNRTPETDYINIRKASVLTGSTLLQQGATASKNRSGYGGAEFSYDLDSLKLLSGQFGLHGNKGNGHGSRYTSSGQGSTAEAYDLHSEEYRQTQGAEASLNYQLGFAKKKGRLLTLSYRYATNASDYDNLNLISRRTNFTAPDYRQENNSNHNEQTFQADYVHPLKKAGLESGIKMILRNNESDFRHLYKDPSSGLFVPDNTVDDRYLNQQDILAFYSTYRFGLSSWDVAIGARVEHTHTRADFISQASALNRRYVNVVPSINLYKKLSDKNSIEMGFSQRIKRPGIRQMNPFVDRSNPNFEISGNPALRSSVIHSIRFGFNRSAKASLNLGLGYGYVSKIALQVSSYDALNNITRVTFQNLGKGSGLDLNMSYNYPATKTLTANVNSTVSYVWLEGMVDGELAKVNRLSTYNSLTIGYRLDKGWRLNADLQVNGRNQVTLQGTSNAMLSTGFGINKEMPDNKLSFGLSFNNPFRKFRDNQTETIGAGFVQTETRQDYFRSGRVSLNYNFGKLKGGVKRSKRSIRNDDQMN